MMHHFSQAAYERRRAHETEKVQIMCSRGTRTKHNREFQHSAVAGPLEFLAIDNLEPFLKKWPGSPYVVVMLHGY